MISAFSGEIINIYYYFKIFGIQKIKINPFRSLLVANLMLIRYKMKIIPSKYGNNTDYNIFLNAQVGFQIHNFIIKSAVINIQK